MEMTLPIIWTITRRWWWLALLPALVIGALGVLTFRLPPTGYSTAVRVTAGLPPVNIEADGYDPLYHSWLSSEYLVAALSDWVKTGAFAEAVSAELARQGHDIPAAAIQGGLASDYVRSVLVVYVNSDNPERLLLIAQAAVTVLQTENGVVFPQLGGLNATVTQLDTPGVGVNAPGLRSYLDLVVRLGAGLVIGAALAVLAYAFDPYVRTADDLRREDLPLLGQIPRE